ncbi:similar to Saccharomyces cerevisiae YKL003C MRP17 Mitochondrial ribosomal protein of the small subunit [Maudiozyma saulgeensis]|uniref:Small ribosomal subunit protein bS6m n=1 Tax=Maudiozyma saulgeensis TaxID=1789683 RepID=A0A1X7R079_9SACH|nr:similar to Saccharomyces cerevisiae YKL003C MRP17 Mitochondrial ribosomal protein of the small subunit [Kazachstania saulgeensis]
MLYELVGIVRTLNRASQTTEAKELLTTVGKLILNNRGVIRKIVPLGQRQLPKIMKKDQEQHINGYHFLMLFDSSAAVQSEILRTLKKDPRVIRSSIVKVDLEKRLNTPSSLHKALGQDSVIQAKH